ncbi:MAG: hypothetical protein C3F11_13795 [Methylocystaceae bacterium]|nr:MAG: hypothetical protein C3F11_13795 [Methylocystaceae bacterium]
MLTLLAQAISTLVCLAAVAVASFVFLDGSLRRAFLLAIFKRLAQKYPPAYAIVGDSLATQSDWRSLGRHPLDVINLAKGGATIKEIAGQALEARDLGARCVVIDGGLNDLLFDEAPIEQIEYDFRALLRRIGANAHAIVTLMPYVADPALAPRIDAANRVIGALAKERGFAVVDLNPRLSSHGARKSEMTDDGLHFTPLASSIWVEAVRAAASGEAGLAS